ncbi:hypothetical protein [Staphylococcus phage PT1-4]
MCFIALCFNILSVVSKATKTEKKRCKIYPFTFSKKYDTVITEIKKTNQKRNGVIC